MAVKTRTDIDAGIDRLYQLPLDQFVQGRNELASRLRGEGSGDAALRVQSLAKPSVSAWAVNQLYWRERPAFDALMKAGRTLRTAQEATLRGRAADVRDAGKERDAALVAALERALDLLQQAGHPLTPAMRLRIATNLDALAAYGGTPPGAAAGRMVEDLEPPGFEVFAGLQSRAGKARKPEPDEVRHRPATPKIVSFEAIRQAKRALTDAEHALAEKRAKAHHAATALEQARSAVESAQAEANRAKAAWEEAERRVTLAERAVPQREEEAEQARRAAEQAAQAVEQARAALEAVKRQRGG